jgi:hypothetical protein
VFVSAKDGDDSNGDGSRDKPFASIAAGLAAAKIDGKKVLACATGGAYAESIVVSADLDGASLHGGFDCDDWSHDAATKTVIESPTATAFAAHGLSLGLVLEDFEVRAADGTSAGEPSFALVAVGSQNVVLRRVALIAGNGADGADGAAGDPGADGATAGADQNGKNASCDSLVPPNTAPGSQLGGAWPAASACASRGGAGGGATKAGAGSAGSAGTPDSNVTPAGLDNGGAAESSVGQTGEPGASGAHGNAGNNGVAAPAGGFTESGFVAGDGLDGVSGFPGQGGGGGGATAGPGGLSACVGASGGAGGMGGCGGGGGRGGGGGGASVALLAWLSDVTLEDATLTAGNGGAGGKGGDGGEGGDGKPGATGGQGTASVAAAGSGGLGGNGGPGGSGAGGSGGPSHALVWHAAEPTRAGSVTLTEGIGGTKGSGGSVGGASPAPDGLDGAASAEHEAS